MAHLALEPRSRRAPALPSGARAGAVALGAFAGILTLAVYLIGGNRSLDYDSGVTVGNFVATPSVADSLTRQIGVNNHPALSLLDHIVYSMGGTSELALRVVPALFGAATVGLVAGWCARRFTPVAGISRRGDRCHESDVRRALAGGAGVQHRRFLRRRLDDAARGATRQQARLEGLHLRGSLALGLATHLAFGVVLVGHAAFVLARGEFGRHWIRRCLVAGACGSVVYIGMLRPVGGSILKAGRDFYPSFPADLASAVLGGRALTIIPLAILVLAGARRMSREWLVVAGGSLPSSALSGSCQNRPAFSTRASSSGSSRQWLSSRRSPSRAGAWRSRSWRWRSRPPSPTRRRTGATIHTRAVPPPLM